MSNFQNPLEVMPEDYYFNTVRPQMQDIIKSVTFDPILVDTVRLTMNKADGSATNKDYMKLKDDLYQLSVVLISSPTYRKTDEYIRATEEERKIVNDFSKDLQELLTIANFTKEQKEEKKQFNKERLGYDEITKENILSENTEVEQKKRLPNV